MVPLKTYLCYIEGQGVRWQGLCVDFDLTVAGTSLEEVKVMLHRVVSSYVADAMAEDEPDRTRLLSRRSPWHTRLLWRTHVALTMLGHRLGKVAAASVIRLPAPCPV